MQRHILTLIFLLATLPGITQKKEAKNFLTDIIAKAKTIGNDKCLGVFYWEPQCYGGWNAYTKGAFDDGGRPTIALEAFKATTE